MTVVGGPPLVDVQNVTQRTILSRTVVETIPIAKTALGFAALTPAIVSQATAQDVGGSRGETSVRMAVHGGKQADQKLLQDGMRYNAMAGTGTNRAFYINPASAQEIVISLGAGGSAEVDVGGVQVNLVPKDGGNTFSGYFFTTYTDDHFQADNLTGALRDRGLRAVNEVGHIYDVNGAVGGPLKRNELWFYSAHRAWGETARVANLFKNATQGAPTFTPDFSRPAYEESWFRSNNIRFTWQATQKHKITASYDLQASCLCSFNLAQITGGPGSQAYEASNRTRFPAISLTQSTWTYPATNRLLFSAGVTWLRQNWPRGVQDGVTLDHISTLEQSTGFRYNAPAGIGFGEHKGSQVNARASVSYVTGSHNLKAGLFFQRGVSGTFQIVNNRGLTYTFNDGSPTQLTQHVSPRNTEEVVNPDLGLYVQDQWTIKRLTLNLGLRFDYLRAYAASVEQPAGPLIPYTRIFDKVDCLPCWKDISPRFGASYDPTGSGRTAIKVSVGRYVAAEAVQTASTYNPVNTSVNSVNRSWTDANRNFTPECDFLNPALNGECGPMSNVNFGRLNISTRPDPEVLNGWGKRGYNWQASVSVDRELTQGVAMSVGYFRTWFGNFTVTDNLMVGPEHYDPYHITAPIDPRLPSGGGYRIGGLYNLNPSRFGQVSNLVTFASNYGKQTEIYNGIDVSLSARLPRGAMLSGGVNVGNSIAGDSSSSFGGPTSATNNCFVVDSPEQLRFCDVQPPYQTRFKIFGSYPLPWDFQASANFQTLPGIPISATYAASNAEIAPSLGRNLSGNARNASVQLIEPFAVFEGRINQFDVRLAKTIRANWSRIQIMLDVYNVLNASPILAVNNTYGPRWREPQQVLDGRLFKVGMQLEF